MAEWLRWAWFLIRVVFDAIVPAAWRPRSTSDLPTPAVHVVVIGGGAGGICVASQVLARMPHARVTIVEREADFGGTWLTNTYPGSACDIPSVLYSYSFEPNPDWSRQWPLQPELLQYFQNVAKKHGLYERVRFNTAVVSCVWSDELKLWTTTVRRVGAAADEQIVSEFVVSSVGQLSEVQLPDIKHLDALDRPLVHSARWGATDVAGKRVAVVGAGASAIQIVPTIAKTAAHVVVFQSSPSWILPKDDFVVPPLVRWLFRYTPLRLLYRLFVFGLGELSFAGLAAAPDSWLRRSFELLVATLRKPLTAGCSAELLAKAQPNSEIGCRRTLFASDWYSTLALPNVTLVDERASEARRGALCSARSRQWFDVDVVCCATGFSATQFLRTFDAGLSLHDYWAQHGTSAYLSLACPHFPNFFITYGPNSNLGFNSIILMIEAQTRQICLAIEHAVAHGHRSVQVSTAAAERWQAETRARLAKLPYVGSCNSWFKTANGDVPNNCAISVTDYIYRTYDLEVNDWEWK